MGKTAQLSGRGLEELMRLEAGVRDGESSLGESLGAIKTAASQVAGIHELVDEIDRIASQTNLLSMNAAIEAAHAGDSGRGFAVVAEEIRRLSEQVAESSSKIGITLRELVEGITRAASLSDRADLSVSGVLAKVAETAGGLSEIYASLTEMSSGTEKVNHALSALEESAGGVKRVYEGMRGTIDEVGREIGQISRISRSNVEGGN